MADLSLIINKHRKDLQLAQINISVSRTVFVYWRRLMGNIQFLQLNTNVFHNVITQYHILFCVS